MPNEEPWICLGNRFEHDEFRPLAAIEYEFARISRDCERHQIKKSLAGTRKCPLGSSHSPRQHAKARWS